VIKSAVACKRAGALAGYVYLFLRSATRLAHYLPDLIWVRNDLFLADIDPRLCKQLFKIPYPIIVLTVAI
jgi:hypothetical protein